MGHTMTTLNVARVYLRVSSEDQDLQRQEGVVSRNPRNFRHPVPSPTTSTSRRRSRRKRQTLCIGISKCLCIKMELFLARYHPFLFCFAGSVSVSCKPVSGENQHMVGISRAGSSGAYFGGYTDPPRMHLGGGLGESEDLTAQLFLHRNSL
ncbi:hypothetical protein ALO65_200240 [Pseudomonas syringae pv. papulans]|nr:hypothetical protein ALO65_200240 [Pseudomonas syringae pv. papulans]RMN72817.1 hypothetical protein ALQ56_200260 [Pseudomonas syringae pv. papulans]